MLGDDTLIGPWPRRSPSCGDATSASKSDPNRTKTHKVNKNGLKSTHKPIILTKTT